MADKRKDLVTNIRGRVYSNVAPYNMTKYKKNEKDLSDKVKFFEKKITTGEMKEYMLPRYQEARVVLEKLRELKGLPPLPPAPVAMAMAAPKPMAMPMTMAVAAPMPKPMAANTLSEPTLAVQAVKPLKRTYTKRKTAVAATAAPVAARSKNGTRRSPVLGNNGNPLRITAPKRAYTRRTAAAPAAALVAAPGSNNGTRRSPVLGNNRQPLRIQVPKRRVQIKEPSQSKALRAPREPIYNEHLATAFIETQQLVPELYNPFTGVKYARDESPMEDVERAYILLRKIRSNTMRKAATMRRKSTKATKATTQKSPNRNNT